MCDPVLPLLPQCCLRGQIQLALFKQQLPMWLLQIRMLGDEGSKDDVGQYDHGDNVFLKKIESHLLTQVGNDPRSLQQWQLAETDC